MNVVADLEALIGEERKSMSWHLLWFIGIVSLGIGLVVLTVVFPGTNPLFKVGSALGGGFVALLAKPPFSEVTTIRRRLFGLRRLLSAAKHAGPGSAEAAEVATFIKEAIRKMAGA